MENNQMEKNVKLEVRKVDNIGRIKIPNQILRDLSINSGSSLEIFHRKRLDSYKKISFKMNVGFTLKWFVRFLSLKIICNQICVPKIKVI